MSFIPFTEKIIKKIGICSDRIRIRIPGRGSADPDPHQNEADPKHWLLPLHYTSLCFVILQFLHYFLEVFFPQPKA